MLRSYYHFALNNKPLLAFGLLTAFFANYGQTFFIAWFGQSFLNSFTLTNTEYGLIYSTATLVSGFTILFVGALLDKTPLIKFTLITSCGLALGCFCLFIANHWLHLFVAIFLLRFCGQGLLSHIAFTSMARYFHSNRGKAIGIVGFGMPLGEAILPAIAVFLITFIGWRETWFLLGVIVLILFIPVMIFLLNKASHIITNPQHDNNDNNSIQLDGITRKQVIKDCKFWMLLPAIMSPAFIVTGIFIHQSTLLISKNWTENWFAICFTIYAFSHLKGSITAGSMVDKYSGLKLIRYYLLPMLIGIGLLALPFNANFIALVFMFLIGLTIGASSPIVGSLWVEIYGNKHIGAIRSLVTSLMVVSTAISPVLFGKILDHNISYSQLMIGIIFYLIISWSVMMIAITKYKQEITIKAQ